MLQSLPLWNPTSWHFHTHIRGEWDKSLFHSPYNNTVCSDSWFWLMILVLVHDEQTLWIRSGSSTRHQNIWTHWPFWLHGKYLSKMLTRKWMNVKVYYWELSLIVMNFKYNDHYYSQLQKSNMSAMRDRGLNSWIKLELLSSI